jgi:hypothetical protein
LGQANRLEWEKGWLKFLSTFLKETYRMGTKRAVVASWIRSKLKSSLAYLLTDGVKDSWRLPATSVIRVGSWGQKKTISTFCIVNVFIHWTLRAW